jgi:hypothetical protein
MAKKQSPHPVVQEADIPRMPWELGEGTSDAGERLDAFADSLIPDEPPADDEPDTVEAETEEVITAEVETEEVEAPAEIEAVSEAPSDDPVFEIDGEKVTLSELRKERLRQADYTRKTQELAEQRKAVEATEADRRVKRDEFVQLLDTVKAALQPVAPSPDLRNEDPAEYAAQWADYQARMEEVRAVEAKQAEILAEQEKERSDAVAAFKAEQKAKLLEAVPEWQDETVAVTQTRKLVEFAKTKYGFEDAEAGNILDARLWLLLKDANAYHEARAKGEEKVAALAPSKVLKPGARPAQPNVVSQKRKEQQELINRHRKTGRESDAIAALMALLPD